MAGIYLHIPFCKKRCIYCDFYSTTRSELRTRYVDALCRELRLRRDYLQGETVRTLYLGGGTPSQLTAEELRQLFDTLKACFDLRHTEEITLEANPDDLTETYVAQLTELPINRISMGIQTFDDATLQLLNRRHTARQAIEAVERCRRYGFDNLSIDLIYGLPGETESRWQEDLRQAMALRPAHLSAYHLTYEAGTPLHRLLMQHQVDEVDEERSLRFFRTLTDTLHRHGYVHYEISNFCLPGCHSRHNMSYWQEVPYLGCGPSAHSYNRRAREWNSADLLSYIIGIEQGKRPYETEPLDTEARYNERVMTSLRTRQGLSLEQLQRDFGLALSQYCLRMASPFLHRGLLEIDEGRLRLTEEGIFISDSILCELMHV